MKRKGHQRKFAHVKAQSRNKVPPYHVSCVLENQEEVCQVAGCLLESLCSSFGVLDLDTFAPLTSEKEQSFPSKVRAPGPAQAHSSSGPACARGSQLLLHDTDTAVKHFRFNVDLARLEFFCSGGGDVGGFPSCLPWTGPVCAAVGGHDTLSLFWTHKWDERKSGEHRA